MHLEKKINQDMYWIGGNDRRLALFENVYPIPRGVSYNSYLVLDEKTVLFDTVDNSVSAVFFANLKYLLDGRRLDYVVIQHLEPDHSATLGDLLDKYPEVKIVTTQKALALIRQFFTTPLDDRVQVVKEGDLLRTGKHVYTFVMAPMVHWPEVMVTYDTTEKILYSADAFGTFGALSGNLFADKCNFEAEWLPDARRYYTNIVGKYGMQVTALLKKAAGLEIKLLCPLHGPVWRENIGWFVDKYLQWGSYTPEEKGVLIAYGSIYGHTQQAAELLADSLDEMGVSNIEMFDTSSTHPSYILSEAFRFSHLVFASATYNNGLFDTMQTLLHDISTHNLQNRTIAFIENGSWAPVAGKLMKATLGNCKNNYLDQCVSFKSAVKEEQRAQIKELAKAIAASLHA